MSETGSSQDNEPQMSGTDEDEIRYVKPCMTNMPPEIGIPIFKQIMSTPKTDMNELNRKVDEWRKKAFGESGMPENPSVQEGNDMKSSELMTNERFLALWNDKDRERSVVIKCEDGDELTVVVCFPPDEVAVGKMQLCGRPVLSDLA